MATAAPEYTRHLAVDVTGKFNHPVGDVQSLADKTQVYSGAN